jgi:hypothetical protein
MRMLKPLPVIKEPGPYITARHIRFKFGSIPLGKKNLCGATPPEGLLIRGALIIRDGFLLWRVVYVIYHPSR